MPLVILLTLVAGLAVAVLFQRAGVAGLAARRQADDYTLHHAKVGLMELINRWHSTVRGRLKESIDDDGYAFSLQMPGNARVDVFVEDGQGKALARTESLVGRRREIVELMNVYLDQLPEELQGDARRQYGPSEVSIRRAPRDVVVALAAAINGPERAAEVADALIERMDDQSSSDDGREVSVQEITRTLSELQVEPEQITEFEAMLVTSPVLWWVTAEVRDSGNNLIERAGGYWEVSGGTNLDSFNQRSGFLSWDTLPLEDAQADRERREAWSRDSRLRDEPRRRSGSRESRN